MTDKNFVTSAEQITPSSLVVTMGIVCLVVNTLELAAWAYYLILSVAALIVAFLILPTTVERIQHKIIICVVNSGIILTSTLGVAQISKDGVRKVASLYNQNEVAVAYTSPSDSEAYRKYAAKMKEAQLAIKNKDDLKKFKTVLTFLEKNQQYIGKEIELKSQFKESNNPNDSNIKVESMKKEQ